MTLNKLGTTRSRTALALGWLLTLLATLLYAVLGYDDVSAATTITVCTSGCDFATIQAAVNAASDGDTIQVLTALPHTEFDIVVNRSVTIKGLGEATTTVQADASPGVAPSRVFLILSGLTVQIEDLTIRHGVSSTDGGGIMNDGSDLTLTNVRVQTNEANGKGGGIYHKTGLLTLNNVRIANNAKSRSGGGLYNDGSLIMNGSAILNNFGPDRGGGLFNEGSATIRNSTIGSNEADDFSGFDLQGGGIFNSGTMTLIGSLITNNSVEFDANLSSGGGGIFNSGELNVYSSLIRFNETASFTSGHGILIAGGEVLIVNSAIEQNGTTPGGSGGGGIYMRTGTARIIDSTISNNTGSSGAGLSFFGGDMEIVNSTVQGNSGFSGAGLNVCNQGLALSNVTISQNEAITSGGGILVCSNGEVDLANVTISENIADADDDGDGNGGGLYLFTFNNNTGVANLRNTIIAGNFDLTDFPGVRASDCYDELNSEGYNLIGTLGFSLGGPPCSLAGNTTGNQVGVNPMLDTLADNGGPTETHALLSGSPAIDKGNPAGCLDFQNNLLDTDQRGGLRPDRCDTGAFELGALIEHLFLPSMRKQ